MSKRLSVSLLMFFLLIIFSPHVFGITDEEVFRNFRLSFVNPGARSVGMGGAFIGLADDATAAEANPAGLTILVKPEVSVEYRNIRTDSKEFDQFTSVSGAPFGGSFSVASLTDFESEELNRPSFLSVVFPAGNSTFAFSRQESVEVQSTANNIISFFFDADPTQNFSLPFSASQDLEVVNYNFSGATKLGSNFSIGASLRYSHLDWQAGTLNSFISNIGISDLFQTSIDETDSGFGWNIGGLANLGPHASVGAVYKKNPKFEVPETVTDLSGFQPELNRQFTNVLKIPDTFGVGIAIKPSDNFTITSDVVHIEYSDLEEGFVGGLSAISSFISLTPEDVLYKVDNGVEYHVGAETTVILKSTPVALRIGYYRKPSASLEVDSSPGLSDFGRAVFDSLYPEPIDENHFSFGGGVVLGQHFQLDFAMDTSNASDTFVLSSVVRF